ncbi:PadR family transcriptional regulator [Cellulomonas soli]|nr:PadR family transcriptional regulator [Cellulomonas soli]NYI59894.1 PadR family transcriptional regulator PadR [Cellulomonas soli]
MDDSSTSQLRRGVIGPCILALLATGPRYGLQIVKELDQGGRLLTSQGTVYPLLTRLSEAGLIRTAWEEIESGRSRRYYEPTPAGLARLEEFIGEWSRFTSTVDALLTRAPDSAVHEGATEETR